MSKTIGQIQDSILIEARKYSDDIKVEKPWLRQAIKDVRATLIRDEMKRTKTIAEGFYQLVSCLEVERQITNCNSNGVLVSGYKVSIPGLMRGVSKPVVFIGSHNLETRYDIIGVIQFLSFKNSAWGGWLPVCTIIEDFALFKNLPNKTGEYMSALALFEDFTEVCGFDDEKAIPVPALLIVRLEMLVLRKLLGTYGVFVDFKNDDTDEELQRNLQEAQRKQAKQ